MGEKKQQPAVKQIGGEQDKHSGFTTTQVCVANLKICEHRQSLTVQAFCSYLLWILSVCRSV